MSAAKRKISVPNLEERVEALREELEEALDQLAEARRPQGIPHGSIRRMIDAKGFGDCLCRSYISWR